MHLELNFLGADLVLNHYSLLGVGHAMLGRVKQAVGAILEEGLGICETQIASHEGARDDNDRQVIRRGGLLHAAEIYKKRLCCLVKKEREH